MPSAFRLPLRAERKEIYFCQLDASADPPNPDEVYLNTADADVFSLSKLKTICQENVVAMPNLGAETEHLATIHNVG